MTPTYRAMQISRTGHLQLVERPLPQPEQGEVLISVEARGICGANRGDIASADPAAQRVPGNEVVGRIVAIGAQVPEIWQRASGSASAGSAVPAWNAPPAGAVACTCAAISLYWDRAATADTRK